MGSAIGVYATHLLDTLLPWTKIRQLYALLDLVEKWGASRVSDRLLKRPRASRLDNSHHVEIRKPLRVDPLISDDFALQGLDPVDTADIYELNIERHRTAAPSSPVIVSKSNARPHDRPAPRPISHRPAPIAAHELVVDCASYRQRQRPIITNRPPT